MAVGTRLFRCTWGLTRQQWDEAREHFRALLVGVAASGATITYGEIAQIVFAGRFSARSAALYQMLDEVCTLEDAQTNCYLASVVVRADSGIPGKGYYVLAKDASGKPLDAADPQCRRDFWQAEVERVWEKYGN